MIRARHDISNTALAALEAAAATARGGFACMFSSSDEYESALIRERRAQGRYAQPRRNWPVVAFAAATLTVAASVVWLF